MWRTINITYSSNLLGNTSHWDNLKNDYKLNFSDSGFNKNFDERNWYLAKCHLSS